MLIDTLNECIIDMRTVREMETVSADTKKQATADYNFKQMLLSLKQTIDEVNLAVENSEFRPSANVVSALKSFLGACDKVIQTGAANNATTQYISSESKKIYAVIGQEWALFYTEYTQNTLSLLNTIKGILKDDVEQKFGLYTTILWSAPLDEACKSVSRLFSAAEACEKRDTSSNVFETITKFAEKYFYDPNSPLRNEEFYLPYVEGLAKSECVPEAMRPAYSYDASMCALNRIGTKAADFSFKDLRGKVHTLYGVKADYTLLFFSNPGCPNCREITEMI